MALVVRAVPAAFVICVSIAFSHSSMKIDANLLGKVKTQWKTRYLRDHRWRVCDGKMQNGCRLETWKELSRLRVRRALFWCLSESRMVLCWDRSSRHQASQVNTTVAGWIWLKQFHHIYGNTFVSSTWCVLINYLFCWLCGGWSALFIDRKMLLPSSCLVHSIDIKIRDKEVTLKLTSLYREVCHCRRDAAVCSESSCCGQPTSSHCGKRCQESRFYWPGGCWGVRPAWVRQTSASRLSNSDGRRRRWCTPEGNARKRQS